MIKGESLRMSFAGVEVVKGVDIELRGGEVRSIVGENGAGKSTVAKMLAGVYQPSQGRITLEGREVHFDGPRAAIHQGVALIHQEPLTFPDLDVAENVFVGHQPLRGPLRKVDWKSMNDRAEAILRSLGVHLDLRAKVGSLSVADQQMVELACALSHEAKVLIFDETTASLTPKEVRDLFAIIRRLKDQGAAIAFVSHHLDEVIELSDVITVMRDGEVVGELTPSQTTESEIVKLMVGRSVTLEPSDSWGHAAKEERSEVLRVLSLSDGRRFHDVSFSIFSGEIVGMAGLVGSGRTDIAQALFGVNPIVSGSVHLFGKPYHPKNPRDAMSRGVALVPEDRQHEGLLMAMQISENATLASIKKLASGGWLRKKKERLATQEYAQQLGLVHRSISQPVRELSGGNQQKVVLGKWLMTHPGLLILDEPTRGIDVGAKAEVHRLIRDLAAQGMGILMISSDLPEVLALSDRILVMKEGHLARHIHRIEATPENVMEAATAQVAIR